MRSRVLLVLAAVVLVFSGLGYAYFSRDAGCEDLDLAIEMRWPEVTLRVTNTGERAARLTFPTAQEAEFLVSDGDDVVWKWSDDMVFAEVVTRRVIEPGEAVTYTVEIPGEARPDGAFDVIARLVAPGCTGEARTTLGIDRPDVRTDSGRFAGRIDLNSIEVRISGVPDEIGPRVFRLSDEARERFEDLALAEGDVIRFDYRLSEAGQDVIIDLERID